MQRGIERRIFMERKLNILGMSGGTNRKMRRWGVLALLQASSFKGILKEDGETEEESE